MKRKDANELNERISREEVDKCVKKQKNGNAAGLHDIPYELYKDGGEVVIDWMTDLFDRMWEEERVPSDWNECSVTLIHKGGHKSKSEIKNYKPISLGKVFSAVLNDCVSGLRGLGCYVKNKMGSV